MLLAESPPLQQAEERRADRARIVKTTKKSLAEFCPLANREIFNYTAADQTASFPPQFIIVVLRVRGIVPAIFVRDPQTPPEQPENGCSQVTEAA